MNIAASKFIQYKTTEKIDSCNKKNRYYPFGIDVRQLKSAPAMLSFFRLQPYPAANQHKRI